MGSVDKEVYQDLEFQYMQSKSLTRVLLQSILLVSFFFAIQSVQAREAVVVVTSPHSHHKEISVNTLRAIFGMRLQTWPDGSRIHVFVLQDSTALHREFAKGILNVFPYQLRSAWDRMVFSGTGQAPIRVNSVTEMRNKVSHTPGAIGYLWRDNVDESVDVVEIR